MKHLSTTQVVALIAVADTDRNKLLFRLTYEHGLRISECLSLTRAHVRKGFLMIRGKKKGKRTDEKVSPATLALFESVTKTLAPNTLIFPFSRQWASAIFHRACHKAKIELQLRQGVHSLRHSLAHHLLDAGAPLPVVQKSLRHRSIGSTGVYLEADGRDVDQWRQKAIGGACEQGLVAQAAALASCGQKKAAKDRNPSPPSCIGLVRPNRTTSCLDSPRRDVPSPADTRRAVPVAP
jgi:integrase